MRERGSAAVGGLLGLVVGAVALGAGAAGRRRGRRWRPPSRGPASAPIAARGGRARRGAGPSTRCAGGCCSGGPTCRTRADARRGRARLPGQLHAAGAAGGAGQGRADARGWPGCRSRSGWPACCSRRCSTGRRSCWQRGPLLAGRRAAGRLLRAARCVVGGGPRSPSRGALARRWSALRAGRPAAACPPLGARAARSSSAGRCGTWRGRGALAAAGAARGALIWSADPGPAGHALPRGRDRARAARLAAALRRARAGQRRAGRARATLVPISSRRC